VKKRNKSISRVLASEPASGYKTLASLPFRFVANGIMGSVYEATAADGRVIRIQISNEVESVTWDGSMCEDGTPKISVGANLSMAVDWKPTSETPKASSTN